MKVDGDFFLSLCQKILCTGLHYVTACMSKRKEQNNEILMKNAGNYTNNVLAMWKITSDYACSGKKQNNNKNQQVSNLWMFTIDLIITLFSLCLQTCMDNFQEMLSVLDECFMTDFHPHCDFVMPRANYCISRCQASRNLKVTMKTLALVWSLDYSHHAKIWLIGNHNTLAWHPPTLWECIRKFSHPFIIGFSHQPQSDWINPHTTILDHHRSTGDPQWSVINPDLSLSLFF